jgi:hypothetical protein
MSRFAPEQSTRFVSPCASTDDPSCVRVLAEKDEDQLLVSCVGLLALTVSLASAHEARRGTVVGLDQPTGSITILQSPDGTIGCQQPRKII